MSLAQAMYVQEKAILLLPFSTAIAVVAMAITRVVDVVTGTGVSEEVRECPLTVCVWHTGDISNATASQTVTPPTTAATTTAGAGAGASVGSSAW